ncbi:hypothetical protein [Micromonospora zhanjiangensis]
MPILFIVQAFKAHKEKKEREQAATQQQVMPGMAYGQPTPAGPAGPQGQPGYPAAPPHQQGYPAAPPHQPGAPRSSTHRSWPPPRPYGSSRAGRTSQWFGRLDPFKCADGCGRRRIRQHRTVARILHVRP